MLRGDIVTICVDIVEWIWICANSLLIRPQCLLSFLPILGQSDSRRREKRRNITPDVQRWVRRRSFQNLLKGGTRLPALSAPFLVTIHLGAWA